MQQELPTIEHVGQEPPFEPPYMGSYAIKDVPKKVLVNIGLTQSEAINFDLMLSKIKGVEDPNEVVDILIEKMGSEEVIAFLLGVRLASTRMLRSI